MGTPYARRWVVAAWVAAGWAGMAYGLFLTVLAVTSPPGTALTGHWVVQPAFKALMALLLAAAAFEHPIVRERRWLMAALLCSAVGDWLLAIPWWGPSFVGGLSAFLAAHACYLGALLPLVRWSALRAAGGVLVCAGGVALLVWFWPQLGSERLTVPVIIYIAVLCAMVCAALLARLPTAWVAVGALCFAASDAMIGIGRFIIGNDALAAPIWWAYAAAQILITAGFFFGRATSGSSATPAG